jgi:hypothetical protein
MALSPSIELRALSLSKGLSKGLSMEAELSSSLFKVWARCRRTDQLPKSVRDFPQFLKIVTSKNPQEKIKKYMINPI